MVRRLSKKSLWFKLTSSNHFLMKNILLIWVSLNVINEFYFDGMRKLCNQNIEVVDAVFDTHLKLINAHGVDINRAINFYANL